MGEFKEIVKSKLMKLVDHIDVNKAADAMCSDFMASRLPPFGHVKDEDKEEEDEDDENIILLDDRIKIKHPEHIRVVYDNEEENEEEDDEKPAVGSTSKSPTKSPKKKKNSGAENEDDDDEDAEVESTESHICIVHSLNNDRFMH